VWQQQREILQGGGGCSSLVRVVNRGLIEAPWSCWRGFVSLTHSRNGGGYFGINERLVSRVWRRNLRNEERSRSRKFGMLDHRTANQSSSIAMQSLRKIVRPVIVLECVRLSHDAHFDRCSNTTPILESRPPLTVFEKSSYLCCSICITSAISFPDGLWDGSNDVFWDYTG
jgi:hypothetical protein